MNDRGHIHAGSPAGDKRRPLWPWVVGAVVLCLFGAGFKFCWPVYQVNRLLKFADENSGIVNVKFHHPDWSSTFIAEGTFLPWLDELELYSQADAPVSDEQVRSLTLCRGLHTLCLNVSKCSHESIADLKTFRQLEYLMLVGKGQPIPRDWITELPDLQKYQLVDVSVPPAEWFTLLKSPGLNFLTIKDRWIKVSRISEPGNFLLLRRKHLTQVDVDGIAAIPDLKRLTLEFTSSDEAFWQTLSRHQTLERLTISSHSASSPLQLTGTELDRIREIPSLKRLRIHLDLKKQIDIEEAARTRFIAKRPDVLWIRYTADRNER